MEKEKIEGWAILELMGHRKLAGKVGEHEMGGQVLLRLDVPDGEGWSTQFYGPGAIYCLTPTTEETARAFAMRSQPEPIHRWELKMIPADVVDDEDIDDGEF